MRTDFVKRRDREFEAQVAQFLANLGPVKTALGLPANWEAQLQTRKNTASPYIWDLPSEWVGKDIWYRGAWETPRGARGAWSDPARATVAG